MESLRRESESRAKTRKDILQLLTTAVEEREALPEELTSRTNKLLYKIDEADRRTADLVAAQTKAENKLKDLEKHLVSPHQYSQTRRHHSSFTKSQPLMRAHPVDAQRSPVSLRSLRNKLGQFSLTTLLRLRNTSNEPIRLKSGVQLSHGKYVTSINANGPNGSTTCFELYPGTEIPPFTEVLVAGRSGSSWFPTSSIVGKLVYTNVDESWNFEISFRNNRIGNVRRCHVKAYQTSGNEDESTRGNEVNGGYSQHSKNEHDGGAKNEYW